jgi:hypothetical protein
LKESYGPLNELKGYKDEDGPDEDKGDKEAIYLEIETRWKQMTQGIKWDRSNLIRCVPLTRADN